MPSLSVKLFPNGFRVSLTDARGLVLPTGSLAPPRAWWLRGKNVVGSRNELGFWLLLVGFGSRNELGFWLPQLGFWFSQRGSLWFNLVPFGSHWFSLALSNSL